MMTLLFTWLWQGLAIAAATALALRALPRLNAATSHAIWWFSLSAVVAIPAVHLVPVGTADGISVGRVDPLRVPAGLLEVPAFHEFVTACAMLLWTLTVVTGVAKIVGGFHHISGLKRTSRPFDPTREARLPMWTAARCTDRRRLELRVSANRMGGCALGLTRPQVILVSQLLADALEDHALDEIVMHERAHLERRDDWLRLLQAAVRSVAGWHPAVRFIMRRIDSDREMACDDWVVAQTGAARRYARSLADAARLAVADAPAFVPTATGSATLKARVDRLLDPTRDRRLCLSKATSLVSLAAFTMAVVVSPRLTPIVAFIGPGDLAARLPKPAMIAAPVIAKAASRIEVPATVAWRAPVLRQAESPVQTPATEATTGVAVMSSETEVEEPTPEPSAPASPVLQSGQITGRLILVPPMSAATEEAPTWSDVANSTTAAALNVARTAVSSSSEVSNVVTRTAKALANSF
jgi:beta-lactamase regulating signal transducer with metallopeptidase domain